MQTYPIEVLKDGIDFKPVFLPNFPQRTMLRVRVSRRWLTALKYDVVLQDQIHITNERIDHLPDNWDVNGDDNAVEIVDEQGIPRLQLVQSSDYDVYLNAVVFMGDADALLIVNDRGMKMLRANAEVTPDMFPARMFKYPSLKYLHLRE